MLCKQLEEKDKVNNLNCEVCLATEVVFLTGCLSTVESLLIEKCKLMAEELVLRYKLNSLVHFCNTGKFLDEVYFGNKK